MTFTHRAFGSNPLPSDIERTNAVPGLGRLHGEHVGGCTTTHGIDVRFIAEGASEQVPGYARFALEVDAEHQLHWTLAEVHQAGLAFDPLDPRPSETSQKAFAPEIIDAMRAHAEATIEREPLRFHAYAYETLQNALAWARHEGDADGVRALAALVEKSRDALRHSARKVAA